MAGAARDIFVISDLHLGDGGVRDKFEARGKTPELRAFLDHVGSEGGELFILGDLFELWQMNLSLLLVRRREILDHLAALAPVYVPGNHDVDLAHFIGTDFLDHPFFRSMRAPFVRDLGGRRYRFFHGHETDPFNAGSDPGFGRMLAIFGGIFEDENGSPLLASGEGVGDVLEQFGESMLTIWQCAVATMKDRPADAAGRDLRPNAALTPAQDPDRLVEHVAGVRADLEQSGYDVAVLGHTHKPGRIGDWYFNSGTWIGPAELVPAHLSGGRGPPPRVEGRPRDRARDARRAPRRGARPARPGRRRARSERPSPPPGRSSPGRRSRSGPGGSSSSRAPSRSALGVGVLSVSVGQGSSAGWRVLVTAFGVYALLDGAMSLVGASREQPVRRLLSRVRGVASLLLGLVVLRRGYAAEIFVVLVGRLRVHRGRAARRGVGGASKRMVDSRWLLIGGAGSMIAGLVLLLFPTSAVVLKVVLSGYLCYYGAGELLAGVFGQRLPRPAGPAR